MTPIACFVLPWKKKRENRSKSIIMPTLTTSDFGFSSVASLPLTRSNIIVDEGEDDIQSNKSVQPLPPYYYDHTVPSTFITQNQRSQDQQQHLTTSCYKINQRQYTVERREEEGKEDLPPYECTVYKMGFMMIKNELDGPNKKSRRRSWRKLYMVLWGTTIRAYKNIPTTEIEEKKPVWCYSMQDAEAGQASDYRKRHHVIRLRIHQGPQLLIRTKGEDDQLVWIEHLQASINVSLDLDNRKMPQFITSSRRRRRARVHHDRNIPSRHHQREGALI
ncbi:unnamed protein product [Absidia cylindrospora]